MRWLRTLLFSGLPFGIGMSVFFTVRFGPTRGPIVGMSAGLVFGVAIAGFLALQRKRFSHVGPYEGEPVLHQGPANHWRGGEARGGWLILTPTRLCFRSHGMNVQNAPLAIALGDIAAVEPRRSLGLIPNGLELARRSGGRERFVLAERAEWIGQLTQARQAHALS